MPKRDPKTGRFLSADTGKPAGAGSRPAKKAGKRSRTGKAAVGIQQVRCRIGNRVTVRSVPRG